MMDPNDKDTYLLSMLIALPIMAFILYGLYDIAQANPQMFQSSGDSNSSNTFILFWLLFKLLP